MQTHWHKMNYISLILIIGVLSFQGSLQAQEKNTLLADSTVKAPETIKISEISMKSNQLVTQTNQIFETLIRDEDIEKTGRKNDSLISAIDSLLRIDMASNLENNNIRQLKNKLVYWRQIAVILKQEETALSLKIQKIDEERTKLSKNRAVWQNTQETLSDEEAFSSVNTRITEIIQYLGDMGDKMAKKSERLLMMLDKTAELDFRVNEFMDRIEQTQSDQESQIFARHHKSLFTIKWGSWKNWNPIPSAKQYYKEEINQLVKYLELHISRIFILLIIIGILLWIFQSLKKQFIDKEIRNNSFFGTQLNKVFRHSGVLAYILGIFCTVLVFPNRPVIFIDISYILIIIPLIYIIFVLLNNKFFSFLILFGILTILISAIYIFPPDHLLYRTLLLITASTEIGLLWSVLKHFNKHPLENRFNNQLLKIILIFNLIITITGFTGIISGATMLAEVTVRVPVLSAFAAMLLIVSVISIGGLVEIIVDSPRSKKSNVIRLQGKAIKTGFFKLLNLSASIYWIILFLKTINLDRKVFEGIDTIIKHEINIGSANFTLGKVFAFILVIWISVILSRFLQIILEKDVLNKFKLAKGIPYTIGMMVKYSIITVGVFLAVSAAGLPVGSLGILIGAFGVGIGFGLQNIFNNLVSGLILLFERPIQLGDTVEVGSLIGKVKSIGIRSSNVRTFEGAEVIVPNGHFISNEVVNWTLSDHNRRIEIIAGVAYGSDPHKVKDIFLEGLKKHPDIIDEPKPEVFFNAIGESSLDFRILFWTENISEWLRIRSEVMFMVHDLLQENGIKIPFPQRDLHIKSMPSGNEVIKKGNKE